MTTSRESRYPLGPLLTLTGWSMQQVRRHSPCNGTEYATRLAVGVTERTADRLAVEAGLTPWLVWSDFGCVPCALDDCAEMFAPHRAGHIYHTQKCAQRAWALSDEGKASMAASKAKWRADVPDYARSYDRSYSQRRKQRIRAGQVAA